jgi:hypothetical protein
MSNLLLGYSNRVDAATLSGGSWLTASLPLDNLKDRRQAKVARSANTPYIYTANTGTDQLTTVLPHPFVTADPVHVDVIGGALAAPLLNTTTYYARNVSASVITLHPTAGDASGNTNIVNLTTAGSGTQIVRKTGTGTSAALVNTRFRADLGATYNCRACALVNHNLSAAARWRVRLGAASMDIDLTHPALDERITLTRATAAWRVNAAGNVAAVASGEPRFDYNPVGLATRGLLIEEARTNLFLYSEYYGATWTLTAGSLFHNAVRSPDGLLRGSKFIEDTSAGVRALRQTVTFSAGQTYTSTVYALASERSVFTMVIRSDGTNIRTAHFTLSGGGSVAVGDTTLAGSQRIVDAGNGWYRCTLTATVTGAPASSYVDYRISSVGSPASGGDSYTGNGYSGMYFWGSDVALGAFSTSYIQSTDSFTSRASTANYVNSAGLIAAEASAARINYNPADLTVAPKLLLEPASTNLLLRCSEFDNASWVKTAMTITANAVTGPDGTLSADILASTNANGEAAQTTAAFGAGSVITVSAFAKRAGNGSWFRIQLGGALVEGWFDIANGAVGTNTAGSGNVLFGGMSVHAHNNDWWRCRLTVLTSAVTTLAVTFSQTQGDGGDTAGSRAVAVWHAQAEVGQMTSPITTTSATVTRSADLHSSVAMTRNADSPIMTGSNFSDWYSAAQGTFYAEFSRPIAPTAASYVISANDAGSNSIRLAASNTPNMVAQIIVAGVTQADITILSGGGSDDVTYKEALSYANNDVAASHAGGAASTDTVTLIPSGLTQLDLGQHVGSSRLNGHLKRVAFWPTARTDAELALLTASGPSAIDYDSGWINALQMTLVNPLADWGATYGLIAVASAQISARYVQIDFDDQANAAGYVEFGRLFVAGAIQPTYNASYGLQDGWWDGLSSKNYAKGGAAFVTKRRRLRTVAFGLEWLSQAEADEVSELQMQVGVTDEVLYTPDPADAAKTQRYGYVGEIEELDAIAYPMVDTRSVGFRIKELA